MDICWGPHSAYYVPIRLFIYFTLFWAQVLIYKCDLERSVSLKDKFNVIYISPTNKTHVSPHRAIGRTPGFGQEAEAGASNSFRLESLLGFLRER